ncbi:hypothetical protein H9L13_11630 [Sphingomonas lutea]|uniref:Uncharacterized protein n=1 Tax=Sphingomonas lutea TaxID=1045317 RepID=A0A7G9SHC1_9SPHN|nr:hypothetical protein [Sphingomonas lutea]QNN67246.1 hypothetical protein H9L13_11630 [Sphingomonas lutea]
MRHHAFAIAIGFTMIASVVSAQPDSGPLEVTSARSAAQPAPPGGPDTRYCMRVEVTGNAADPVRCWTRADWADQGVDVDRDWAKEGVRVIG